MPVKEAPATEENLAAAGDQTAAGDPAAAIKETAGDGKMKLKKSREAAAEAKAAERRRKSAGASQPDASDKQNAETPSATSGKRAGDGSQTPAAPQAAANVMQSVLEVLKNAEKSAATEDVVGSITDARANAAVQSAKASTAREGGSAPASAGSDAAAHVVRAQFVQRVERAFAAMGNRDGSVRLKLSPPELGVLKLEIAVHKGELRARVEAETPAAKSLLLDNLPALRDRLAQQNIHVQQFDVDLMDRQPGGMPQHAFGQSDSGSPQGDRSSPRANVPETAAAVSAAAANTAQRPGMGGGLNVFV